MKFKLIRRNQTKYPPYHVYDKDAPVNILCCLKRGGYHMRNISQEYLLLFNAITDAEETLAQMREDLIAAQQQAEELFMAKDEAVPPTAGV